MVHVAGVFDGNRMRLFVDGKLQHRKVVQSRVVRDAHRKIVRIGTGPNWIGLARCESGGNPNAVNPSGFYGLYQFSLPNGQKRDYPDNGARFIFFCRAVLEAIPHLDFKPDIARVPGI